MVKTQALQVEQEKNLANAILNSSVDLIVVYDTETRILYYGKICEKHFGKKKEEVIGQKLLDVFPQMKDTKSYYDLLRAIKGETIHNETYYSPVWQRYYENFLTPLTAPDNKIYAVLAIAHDNTEVILAAEKQQQANLALEEAQRLAQVGSWEWDVVTDTLSWSSTLYQIYGINQSDGMSFAKFADIIHPEDREWVMNSIKAALETKQFPEFDHRIVTSEGITKRVHSRGEVVVNEKGEVIKMRGTGQDITAAKIAEEKLEERNRFVETLINSSPDLIMVIDKDLRFITLNKKAGNILGEYFKESVIGKKITDVNPKIEGTQPWFDVLKAMKGEVVITDRIKSTVSENYYEHNYIPLKNFNHEVHAVMVISHDITAQVQNEQSLKQSEEKFNTLFQFSPFSISLSEVSTGKFIDVNENYLKTFGFTRDEVIGRTSSELGMIDATVRQEILSGLNENGSVKNVEAEVTTKSGEKIPVLISIETITIGEKKYFLNAINDIIERKKAEEQIEENNRRLQQMNKELESFAYVSGHDLQEPLRRIQTFAGRIIKSKEGQNLTDKGKDYFYRMQESANQMQQLIKDLLAFSRVNAAERKFENTDLNKIIEEVKAELKEVIEEKHATIEVNEMCEANIIPFQFRQLLQNLIGNSLKFSQPAKPPHIIIKSNNIIYSNSNIENLIPGKEYCHITVTDNGIGFEPEYSKRIFEVFQKLHGAEVYQGTGIGLAIVKKIVENHQGVITATSELKKGATFDIYIPAN